MEDKVDNLASAPLVTFALITYNQEQFVSDAIEGAFSQSYHPLEILLSDDCSSDGTYKILKNAAEKYRGPHSIKVNRNVKNLGLVGHINKVFEISSGEIIVAAAGDDISLPERTDLIVRKFVEESSLLVHSFAHEINNAGNETGRILPDRRTFKNTSVRSAALSHAVYLGATGAWSKELFEIYGQLTFSNAYEDLTLGFRAILEDRIGSLPIPLVKYRSTSGMSSQFQVYKGWRHLWRQKLRYLEVRYDVLRQRQTDCQLSDKDTSQLRSILRLVTRNVGIKIRFYKNPRSTPQLLREYGFAAARLLTIELAFLARKIIAGNFNNLHSQK